MEAYRLISGALSRRQSEDDIRDASAGAHEWRSLLPWGPAAALAIGLTMQTGGRKISTNSWRD